MCIQNLEDGQDADDDGNEVHGPKNIRRRVYDALNVLMAMNIIAKDRKDIRWIGLPTSAAQEVENIEDQKKKIQQRLTEKRRHLHDLIIQVLVQVDCSEKE